MELENKLARLHSLIIINLAMYPLSTRQQLILLTKRCILCESKLVERAVADVLDVLTATSRQQH